MQRKRKEAAEKVAKSEGVPTSQRTVDGKETFASKVQRGGGFNKGGLMQRKR